MLFNNIPALFTHGGPEAIIKWRPFPSVGVPHVEANLYAMLQKEVYCFLAVAEAGAAEGRVQQLLVVDLQVSPLLDQELQNLGSVTIASPMHGCLASLCDEVDVDTDLLNQKLNNI